MEKSRFSPRENDWRMKKAAVPTLADVAVLQ
jgi:hypothetical protein